jgi:hypothetical protein
MLIYSEMFCGQKEEVQYTLLKNYKLTIAFLIRGLSVKEGSQWFFTMKNMFIGID